MKKIFAICLLLLTGCAELRKGEVRDVQCRVLGLDASIPVPFAQSINVVNIRIGWVDTDYLHSYKVKKTSSAVQEIKYLGSAERHYDYEPQTEGKKQQ